MAQYKADILGSRGPTSRLGGKTSGISSWVRGWHSGIEVRGRWDEETQQDVFFVYKTGGSGTSHSTLIGKLDQGGKFILSDPGNLL
tara:strand:- start:157 stop:414 length:258 start_codon:yes stop_codon:yes gene_type:complete